MCSAEVQHTEGIYVHLPQLRSYSFFLWSSVFGRIQLELPGTPLLPHIVHKD